MKWFLLLGLLVVLLAYSTLRSNDDSGRATDRELDALEHEIDPT